MYASSLFRLQLTSPFVFFPILSAPTDQRPEQTSTLDAQTRGRRLPQDLRVVQSDVCRGQHVSANQE